MGSEMCIRDSPLPSPSIPHSNHQSHHPLIFTLSLSANPALAPFPSHPNPISLGTMASHGHTPSDIAAQTRLLKRLLILEDRRVLGAGLAGLLLLLVFGPLPLLGLRALRLALAAFTALTPTLYFYRGLVIRWTPQLPCVRASTSEALMRAYLRRILLVQLGGMAGFVSLAAASSLVVVLPLLSPCAAVEPDSGVQAAERAQLACLWAGVVGAAYAARVCLYPTFGQLPWHNAAFPVVVRFRAHLSRAALEAPRFCAALLIAVLALGPLLLTASAPLQKVTALWLVSSCRASSVTGPRGAVALAAEAAVCGAASTQPSSTASSLLRSLLWSEVFRMFASACWMTLLLEVVIGVIGVTYARHIPFWPPVTSTRRAMGVPGHARSATPTGQTPSSSVLGPLAPGSRTARVADTAPPSESLLLCAMRSDQSPLTQHLAFFAFASLASHESHRRRAILNAPSQRPQWTEFFAAARRPLESSTEALLAARRMPPIASPSSALGAAAPLLAPMRKIREIRFLLYRRAVVAEATRASEVAAWAALGLARIAAAARHEDRCDEHL